VLPALSCAACAGAEGLWESVLAERVSAGAGSRQYVTGVLKQVVNMCDAERHEVSELLLEKLLVLQAGAAAHKAAAELAERTQLSGTEARGPRPEPEPEPEPDATKVSVLTPGIGSGYVVPAPIGGAPHLLQPRHVVSLGCDCFCRTQATGLGFIRRRLEGYESGPFDIAYHSYSAVCSLLRDDFAGYMEPGSLVLDTVEGKRWGPRSARSFARGAIHRTLPGVAFNHEAEPVADPATFDAWAANDFSALRERYIRRTDNFRTKLSEAVEASVAGGVGVVFLLQHYEHPCELCEVIER
jgi:hypothetical protein